MLQGSFPEAVALAGEAYSILQDKLYSHWWACQAESVFGSALIAVGQASEGEPHLIEACEAMMTRIGAPSRRIREATERIVYYFERQGRAEEAKTWRRSLSAYPIPAFP